MSGTTSENTASPTETTRGLVSSGTIIVDLDDDALEDVREIARARNESYVDGETADTNYTDSSGEDVHITGIKAEKAFSMLYDEASIDRSVSSTGDNGIDSEVYVGNELMTVDIKASSYDNPWLLVKQGYDHEEADIFVVATVNENTIEFHGWMRSDVVCRDSNLEESPAPGMDHHNYTIRKPSRYARMPDPDISDIDFGEK